ncbi:MAG: hypothetical protein NTX00_02735, partial [Candidatus Parcubacteria bacterium]|nr:hypothetical protein [Candidatus Parcubacteria bacterium]
KKRSNLFISLVNFIFIKLKKIGTKILVKTPKLNEKLQIIKNNLRLKIAYLGNYLKKIPNLSKLLLIIVFLLIILFIYSISYFKQRQQNEIGSAEFQKIAAQIEEKRNQAESDLIYGNEDKARSEITEAQSLLDSLPLKSQKQKDQQKDLTNSLEVIIAKLRHITNIAEPTLIADLSSPSEPNQNLQNLIYQNNMLDVFDSGYNAVYQINLETREIKKIDSNLTDIGSIEKVKKVDNRILAYHDKNGFIEFKDNHFQPLNVSLPTNAKIIDFAAYNGRLYTLDLTAKQIYRQPNLDNGFGPGTAWVKDQNFDPSNIVSFGIDTNIWLLDKTGTILKYNKGRKLNFEPKNLEPKLEAPLMLLTSDETNNLYILEPKNKRVVVLDKEGNLITQYYSQTFNNLKALEISEKEKKMFLIDDSKIYFTDLTK